MAGYSQWQRRWRAIVNGVTKELDMTQWLNNNNYYLALQIICKGQIVYLTHGVDNITSPIEENEIFD